MSIPKYKSHVLYGLNSQKKYLGMYYFSCLIGMSYIFRRWFDRKCDEVDVFIVKEIEKSENDDSLLGRVWSKKIDDVRGNEIEDLF
ncbi:hypothetical protein TL16_g04031 [Triparma laevis f. inornata]|uniref:Uncharacterized protein n=1 Tax=Triparma laevis f. inornata TaxID=1714386 RepID=A0A9W7E3F7_9STRA|nr:hypothetical protein TL16_g04031 [Triparma laevis f. inornata]